MDSERAKKRKLELKDSNRISKKMKISENIQINNFINTENTSKIYVLNVQLICEADANIVINIKRKGQSNGE